MRNCSLKRHEFGFVTPGQHFQRRARHSRSKTGHARRRQNDGIAQERTGVQRHRVRMPGRAIDLKYDGPKVVVVQLRADARIRI